MACHWKRSCGANLRPISQTMLRSVDHSVTLKGEAAQALGIVLHELATNAAKHGAFSNEAAGCRFSGGGCGMGRLVGWLSNGKSWAAPQFGSQPSLAMELVLFASLFRSSWAVRQT